jgi:lipopolysaccharide assembly outer membrane protein LptD (OstA)
LRSLLAAALWLAVAPGAGAESGPEAVEIRADRIVYDVRAGTFDASGNVEVERGGRTLRAGRVSFDEQTGRGVARDDVEVVEGADTLRSSRVDLDIYTLRGVILDGHFESTETGFRAEGARIEKTGPDSYRFEEGRFTTCLCEPGERDPWAIRAGEAELQVEGYGTARNARFEILGVPVVWLPWLAYPVKTERQSGLLLPEVGYSGRHGAELGLPVFLAPAAPLNVTLTPRWLQKRGAKGDVEIEWVAGEESGGSLFGSFLRDGDVDENSASEPFDDERWAVAGRQDLFLPLGARAKADFRFVSDNQYPTDFDELGQARVLRRLESTAFVGGDVGRSGVLGLLGSASFVDDLQSPDDLDRDDFVLQRLPHLEAALLPTPLARWLVPALGVRYTRFQQRRGPPAGTVVSGLFVDTGIDARSDGAERNAAGMVVPGDASLDDFPLPGATELDGRFQEGEPLADEGHRALLTPRLGAPLRLLDLFELYPEVGWHETLYGSDAQGFERRGLLTGRADLRTRLRRRFGGGLVHVLEPQAGWAFVWNEGQRNNPLYVPGTAVPQRRLRQLALDNLTLDPADRIDDRNVVRLALGNRLYAPVAGGPSRLLADVAVSGQFDADDGEFGALYLDGRVFPWEGSEVWGIAGFDPEDARLDEALAELALHFSGGHRLAFGYRYLRRVGRFFERYEFARERFEDFSEEFDRVNQVTGSARLRLTERWALSYRGGYSFEGWEVLANSVGVEYFSACGCWSAGVDLSVDPVRGASVSVSWSLTGLGRERSARSRTGLLDAPKAVW